MVFLVHNDRFVSIAVDLCHKHMLVEHAAYSHSAKRFVFAHGGTLTFATAPQDSYRDRDWGSRVMADHYVWEIREDAAVRQAIREVHGRRRETEQWSREFLGDLKAED